MGERGIGSQGRLPWQQHDSLAVSLVDVLAVSVPEEPATRFPVPAGLRRAGPRRLLLSQVSSSALLACLWQLLLTALAVVRPVWLENEGARGDRA